MRKSQEQILNDLEYRMRMTTDFTDTEPGSVARTFMEVLSEEFYDFYTELELSVTMGFVSTASGRYLDMIGELLGCVRELNELDEAYRVRIVNQVYVVAGANLTALRLKALAIEGVNDVVFKEYAHGAGSFACYVITGNPKSERQTLKAVEAAINETKAYGVYADVRTPVLIPVELMVRLIFSSDAGSAEKTTIRQNAIRETRNYIDGLSIGETFVVNELIQRIMGVSDKIKDMDIYGMKTNGIGRYVTNASCKWDERFVLDTLDIT